MKKRSLFVIRQDKDRILWKTLTSGESPVAKKVGTFPVYLKPIQGLSRHDDRLRSFYDRLRRHQDGRHAIYTAYLRAITTVFVAKNCAPQETRPFLPAKKPDFSPVIKDCILLSRNRYYTISSLIYQRYEFFIYTTDGTEAAEQSAKYEAPFTLDKKGTVKAINYDALSGKTAPVVIRCFGLPAADYKVVSPDDERTNVGFQPLLSFLCRIGIKVCIFIKPFCFDFVYISVYLCIFTC